MQSRAALGCPPAGLSPAAGAARSASGGRHQRPTMGTMVSVERAAGEANPKAPMADALGGQREREPPKEGTVDGRISARGAT
jgi:hypothetical protein